MSYTGAGQRLTEARGLRSERGGRVGCSVVATLAGWAAATLYSLIFQLPLLWRNAPPGGLVHDLVEGLAIWAAFTLAVCSGVWLAVALPLAFWLSPRLLVRRGWASGLTMGVGAVLFVGWRLGTWKDLMSYGHSPDNPVTSPLFLEYAGFGCLLALVTTMVYARLLGSTR